MFYKFNTTMKALKHKNWWLSKLLLKVLLLGALSNAPNKVYSQQNLILNPSVENLIYTPTTLGEYIDYSTFYEVRHANVLNWWIPYIDSVEHHWTTDVFSLLADKECYCAAPHTRSGDRKSTRLNSSH